MRPFTLSVLVLALSIVSCSRTKTTNTISTAFPTIAQKQEFLERYVKFRRNYDDLHFRLSFIDGDRGRMPGPTEWDIRLLATVPANEIDQWIDGLSATNEPEVDWIPEIPNAPTNLSPFKWYQDHKRIVGINRTQRIVLYRNHAS